MDIDIDYLGTVIHQSIASGIGEAMEKANNPPMSLPLPKPIDLRDFFAGCALTGIKANKELCHICDSEAHKNGMKQQDMIAIMAYVDADAMLHAREPHA